MYIGFIIDAHYGEVFRQGQIDILVQSTVTYDPSSIYVLRELTKLNIVDS